MVSVNPDLLNSAIAHTRNRLSNDGNQKAYRRQCKRDLHLDGNALYVGSRIVTEHERSNECWLNEGERNPWLGWARAECLIATYVR